jgi:hypothetical protein
MRMTISLCEIALNLLVNLLFTACLLGLIWLTESTAGWFFVRVFSTVVWFFVREKHCKLAA